MKKLIQIQGALKAPKNQRNNFGNYNYRSAEDILEALKPLLVEHDCLLTVSDEIVNIGARLYVKATASITEGETTVSVSAFAREEETKKGMDGAQITGSASSYARKYALNGLFLIDDTKDPDATNNHGKGNATAPPPATKPELVPGITKWDNAVKYIKEGGSVEDIKKKYNLTPKNVELLIKAAK